MSLRFYYYLLMKFLNKQKDITIRSARVFHDRTLGASPLHKFSQEDEKQALSTLRNAEAELVIFYF